VTQYLYHAHWEHSSILLLKGKKGVNLALQVNLTSSVQLVRCKMKHMWYEGNVRCGMYDMGCEMCDERCKKPARSEVWNGTT